jgi:hydroxybutyrate-dimer hydrolase
LSKRILPLFLLFAACSSEDVNTLPSFVVQSSVVKKDATAYNGTTDDLLTGGLGRTGLAGAAPAVSNPPTAAELRRLAIYNNYRALVDITAAGGYGVLYGPNIDVNGQDSLNEGKIAGDEWLAFDDDGSGTQNVTMMVQVPSSFDKNNPCIVTATSSGSRGVYGAIATAGEWGLKHGCAVAYTDKGTGLGVHDLQNNTVNLIDGLRQDAGAAGKTSNFTTPSLSDTERVAYIAANPYRFAVKHAHSQQNPEKDWGKHTLHAIEFAYYMLNDKFGTAQSNGQKNRLFHAGQVLTIAASVSNGGGASLAAVEQDTQHWISGVVAGEPQIQVTLPSGVTIKRGANNVSASAKPLYDYTTTAALYQACASLSSQVSASAGMIALGGANASTYAQTRCDVLKAKGLLTATGTAALADEALAKLNQAGWESDSNLLHSSHFFSYASTAVAVTYANAYSRANVKDNLCNYSFSGVDAAGAPAAANAIQLAQIFGTGNGVPPTGPIALMNNASLNGARRDQVSQSPSAAGPDFNTDGVACLRSLFTGTDAAGAALTGNLLAQSNAVKSGIQQVLRNGRLRGIPTILVQGRADALVPVNHASRAYYALNKSAESNSTVSYYEVTNAQHFDAFLALSPAAFGASLQDRFIPLHRYVVQSLDLMYNHLKSGASLPPSQVVRTTPRCPAGNCNPAPAITPANVPPIPPTPAAADQITFSGGTLTVPD